MEASIENPRDDALGSLLARGMELHGQGQLRAAQEIYEAILARDPAHFDAMHLLGVVLGQTGDAAEAVRLMTRALAINETPAILLNLGLVLASLTRHQEAAVHYRRAITLQSDFAEAYHSLGNALRALGQADEALACYGSAVTHNPEHAEAYNNRGTLLSHLMRHDEAEADFRHAAALRPAFVEAVNNLGNALRELKRPADAVAAYGRALALKPDHVPALSNRIIALRDINRYDAALNDCERLVALRPDDPTAHNERGTVLAALQRHSDAIGVFKHAIMVQPDYADAHWNLALSYLVTGDFERGWPEYEWRWQKSGHRPTARAFTQPLWTGREDLRGKTILLHGEQGYGDALQFCRYATAVKARGGRVILEVPAALLTVMKSLTGPDLLVVNGSPLPAFDCHSSLLSLPFAFATGLASIPAANPYLSAAPEKIERWRERIGGKTGLRIGVAWSGSPAHANDHNRSASLAVMLNAMSGNAQVFSLQKDVREADAAILRANPAIGNFADLLQDFGDTAALASLMDVVISVDTSVAHLAGALGLPTWLLLPFVHDWRWLAGRNDSPWYPTMRIFRQPAFDTWPAVMAEVNTALRSTFAQVDSRT